MRIVHVAPFYHPVIGGVEEVVRRICEYMASKGNEVHVVTYNRARTGGTGYFPKEETINDVHIVRLKPNYVWSHGTYSSELPEVLKKLKPDFVHVHVWRHPHVFQVAKLKDRLGFKAVLHAHAPFHTFSQLGVATWFYHKLTDTLPWTRKALLLYDKVITLTPYEENLIVNAFKLDEDKVQVIPNFIEEKLLEKANKTFLKHNSGESFQILYLGRISNDRNIALLFKAAKYLLRRGPEIEFTIAGPLENNVYRMLCRMKLCNVKYVGLIYSLDQKVHLYLLADAFVNPTIYEAFGISLLEAQAFGLPCIITGVGGQLYAAPPHISSLWSEPSIKGLAETIVKLMFDNELYNKLSRGARTWAKIHNAKRILPLYEELYKELSM